MEEIMNRFRSLLIAALLLSLPFASQAHVHVKKTIPEKGQSLSAPPKVLQVWFSGNVEAEWSKISVKNAKGDRVDTGDARSIAGDTSSLEVDLKPLVAGSYNVRWNVISSDGHRVKGGIDFQVK